MVSSMLKTQKPESPSALKARALNLPRLNINTAAAKPLSPLSASKPAFKRRAPPPPLNIGTSANCSPSSPSSPFLPKTPRAAVGNHTFSGFGEASPSLYDLPTPEPVSWAPSLAVVPPTPTPVTEHSDAKNANMTENIAASLRSEPCTPPWPKRGASLRTTLFDHIGQKHLSPMDLRGYMSASLRK
ncbi:hypothetical protein GGI12_004148 [Dipsacomyces acuminosporus]|nr:hypothetical protein GGI12_004148 [Dipsacomyces acuminosporus]